MHHIYQKTLSKNVTFQGIGLHSGKMSAVKILPSKSDTGILFKRVDLSEKNIIHATFTNVTSAKLCTTLENEHGVKVSTVEHLLAAFYISGIDNAVVEINNEEVPIMDGSAKDFLDILKRIDLIDLPKKRKYMKILSKIELVDGKRKILIEPNENTFEVNFQLDYNNKIIGKQKNSIDFQKDNLDDVSSSRTFCLYEDIEKIKKIGLAKGGSLDNALVIDNKLPSDSITFWSFIRFNCLLPMLMAGTLKTGASINPLELLPIIILHSFKRFKKSTLSKLLYILSTSLT